MRTAEIQQKAKDLGLDPGKMKKDLLIRSIQSKEGYESCYKVKFTGCDQYNCCWRDDCKPH
jgi:hypothetical protein